MKIFYFYITSLLFIVLVTSRTATSYGNGYNWRYNSCEVITAREEMNKALVVAFYQKLFGDLDVSAIDEYLGDPYIQHDPFVEDGREGLRRAFPDLIRGKPKGILDIRRVAADEDLVWVHQRMTMDGRDIAVVDIFRVRATDGKIVEHWDVVQVIPKQARNSNTMF